VHCLEAKKAGANVEAEMLEGFSFFDNRISVYGIVVYTTLHPILCRKIFIIFLLIIHDKKEKDRSQSNLCF
jgi:hypothetical protein